MTDSASAPNRRSLDGLRIVVTRAAHQAEPTIAAFETAGAKVERLPLLEVVPPADEALLRDALSQIDRFQWLVLTSSNAVAAVFEHFGSEVILPEGLRVATIGPATTAAVRTRSIEPAVIAADSTAEGLADALGSHLKEDDQILLPQAADARATLRQALAELGATVQQVEAYAKRQPADRFERSAAIFGDGPLGWVTFTSPSTARNFAGLFTEAGTGLSGDLGSSWRERRETLRAASIGPVTSQALRRLGVEPAAEAETPSDRGFVDAVHRALS